MNDNEKVHDLLSGQQYMVLAVTLSGDTPWVVPVRIREQQGNVFEWDSHLETEHSKALAVNPDAAITIFEKTETAQTGFYAKGRAELIEEFKPGFGRYRFVAAQCWLNDETFVKRKVEIESATS